MLYADDTQIYQSFELWEIDDGITCMQLNAQAVAVWTTQNELELNMKKTNVMIFGSLQYPTTLNRQPQVTNITSKLYSTLSSLKFHEKSLSQTLRKHLIQALALPHFDYCSIVFMHADKTRTLALQTAQMHASALSSEIYSTSQLQTSPHMSRTIDQS